MGKPGAASDDETIRVRNELGHGYYGNVVQAGIIHDGVHIHQSLRDEQSDLENPVIVTVRREAGSVMADVVVEDEPPRMMAPSGTLHIVTLEARTMRAVVLHAARPVVVARRLPRPACLMVRVGRLITPRYFRTDLDADPPRLHAEGPGFPFSISATDVEQFRFEPLASAEEVYWQLEIDWSCAGYEGTIVVNDNGKPFETYPVPALYSDGHSPSILHAGCDELIHHEHGCPALQLKERSTPYERERVRTSSGDDSAARSSDPAASSRIEDVQRAVLELYADTRGADPGNPASWPAYRQLAAHVRTLLSQVAFHDRTSEPFRALFVCLLRYYFLSRQSRLGVRIARPIYDDWVRALGVEHPDTLAMANRLAGCLLGAGENEDARALWADTLERSRRTLGEAHPDTLTVASNLAIVVDMLGQQDDAWNVIAKTLRTSRQELGHDHPIALRAAGMLANMMRRAKDHTAARPLLEDTLRRHRQTFGAGNTETLAVAANLADTLRELGEDAAARELDEDITRHRGQAPGDA